MDATLKALAAKKRLAVNKVVAARQAWDENRNDITRKGIDDACAIYYEAWLELQNAKEIYPCGNLTVLQD